MKPLALACAAMLQPASEALASEYRKEQIAAHEKAVSMFRAYSETGENEALKKWADDTLPALEDHLRMAQELNK